jgi:SAM-dependent methyltransferase
MNDYRSIFQKRASDYHFAMQHYPNARFYEFNNLISETNFSVISEVLDIPSGGGYLKKYIPNYIKVNSADFSEGFVDKDIELVLPEKLPYESNSFDVVYCLSGMHHLKNVSKFIEECLRVTRTNGEFIFADVKKDTSVDLFLNQFVNQYNTLGHKGEFFYEDYFEKFPKIQSKIFDCQYKEYPFVFENQNDMVNFFKLFFGLDKANNTIIYEGIRDILGIKTTGNGIEVNWGLLHFRIKKTI